MFFYCIDNKLLLNNNVVLYARMAIVQKIYILKRGRILLGPYTIAKLEERTLKPTDMIWYDGLPDWTEAQTVPELQTAVSNVAEVQINAAQNIKRRIFNLFSARK